jgi:phosphatidylglycerol lysyltransferase
MNSWLKRLLGIAIVAAFCFGAVWVLRYELPHYHYRDIRKSLSEIPPTRIFIALALTAVNYLLLTCYDALALRYAQRQLEFRRVALASFLGYVSSYNLGAILGGTPVRYRLYSAWGLSTLEITKIVAMCTLTFWLGFCTLCGLVFTVDPLQIPDSLPFPIETVRPLGVVLLLLVVIYLLASFFRTEPLRLWKWELTLPPLRLSLAQIGLACLDLMLAAGVLYVLLPADLEISYAYFLGVFLLAIVAGLVSHIPGGVGVLEAVTLLLLAPEHPAEVIGSLLAFRVIYYLFPLGVAAVLLAVHEGMQQRQRMASLTSTIGRVVPALLPRVLALATFVGGLVLLFSGATPEISTRLAWLESFVPSQVVNVSHFLGSLVGMGLILLAFGLQRRLDAAWFLTVLLLTIGIVVSLLKGADYEEASILGFVLAVLLPCRRRFYRRAALIHQRFTIGWIAAILVVVVCTLWLGSFSHRHLRSGDEFWLEFALAGDASRFLRASAAMVTIALFVALANLLRLSVPRPALPTSEELKEAESIVAACSKTYARLALVGDKCLMFSENRKAFLMYGVEGRSWVALGDPIGPEEEIGELLWKFREQCDQLGAWPVFYLVSEEYLRFYLDLGLSLLKLGEEGRVPLADFALTGKSRRTIRRAHDKVAESGCVFQWIPAAEVAPLLPELRRISDAWLEEKHTREKGFSLGSFDEEYMQKNPVVLVRQNDRIVAFANIWLGAEQEELSLDLMRQLPDSPSGVMEFLFVELMLWGREQGYRWCSLGMAPLSGLEGRRLAPLWYRVGALVFRHGEHFYNFQGLRQYKEKFDPQWRPKYLASPGGLALPRVLTHVTSLISGGIEGVIKK